MTDYGASARRNTYSYHLVDPETLQEAGATLTAFDNAGELSWAADDDCIATGSIELADEPPRDKLIRVKQQIAIPGADPEQVVLGTYFVDSTDSTAGQGNSHYQVSLVSTLTRFADDVLLNDFHRAKGYNVVREIRELVEVDGGRLRVMAGVDTSRVHTRKDGIRFELGTNRLEVLDAIAGWIGCEIGVDEYGYVTIAPVHDPAATAPAYTFDTGDSSVYLAGVDTTVDGDEAVNRVKMYYSTGKATGKQVVTLPDSHPFSRKSTGRWRTYIEQVDDVMSDADLRKRAQKHLDAHAGGSTVYTIKHVSVPAVTVGATVRYVDDANFAARIDCKCEVMETSQELTWGSLCTTKLRVL